jgi:hypothetical protein
MSLKALGLRIQLGHPDRTECPNPENAFNDDFTVIDSDGIPPLNGTLIYQYPGLA